MAAAGDSFAPPRAASPGPAAVSTEWLLRPAGSPLFVFAHQDDETVLAGIIRRIVGDDERGAFVFWTNGDGLAPAAGMEPSAYARIRIAEATESMRRLGASARRKTDLASSEIENYRRLTHVAEGGRRRQEALDYFREEARRVERSVRAADPDRVFVLAWQGGHPEHDLVHVMVARALRRLRRETGRLVALVEHPAYEFVIACAMRFTPWYRGDRRSITLSPRELRDKIWTIEAYFSQAKLIGQFRAVITAIGLLGLVRGRRVTVEEWLSTEQFGVVDPERCFGRSTHAFDAFDYMLDDFEGTPISFQTMVRPVALALLEEP